jgi:hypothetical protein
MAKAKKKASTEQAATAQPGRRFAVVRNVTLPVLKLQIEVPAYITVKDAMRVSESHAGQQASEDGKGAKKKENQMGPATICTVVDLESGEVKTLIVSTVVKSIFEREYPGDAYVGKSFCLVKHAKKEGKNYFNFSVDEVDPDSPTDNV